MKYVETWESDPFAASLFGEYQWMMGLHLHFIKSTKEELAAKGVKKVAGDVLDYQLADMEVDHVICATFHPLFQSSVRKHMEAFLVKRQYATTTHPKRYLQDRTFRHNISKVFKRLTEFLDQRKHHNGTLDVLMTDSNQSNGLPFVVEWCSNMVSKPFDPSSAPGQPTPVFEEVTADSICISWLPPNEGLSSVNLPDYLSCG